MKLFTEHPRFLDITRVLKKTFGKEIPDAMDANDLHNMLTR